MPNLHCSSVVEPNVVASFSPNCYSQKKRNRVASTNLRDTLLVHPSVQGCPGDLARVLALEEEGLGLAILEAEDLAIATNVEFALCEKVSGGLPSSIAPASSVMYANALAQLYGFDFG